MTATLAPEVAALLRSIESFDLPPLHLMTPGQAREMRKRTAHLSHGPTIEVGGPVMDEAIDTAAGPLPVRLYHPGATGWLGSLVYLHGGGWVLGDLDTHDALCRALTNATGLRVMAVRYRLAPENPYPAALEDAWAATRWLAERESGALAVGGDSAGGHLATCVAARARGTALAIGAQLLIYPVTDLSELSTSSYRKYGEGYWLTARAMAWFRSHYVPPGTALDDPDVSPLLRPDLAGMPPAVVVTAGFDVLRDEGEAYAERLRAAGNEVLHRCYEGVIHGFMSLPGLLPQADRALSEAGEALVRLLMHGDDD